MTNANSHYFPSMTIWSTFFTWLQTFAAIAAAQGVIIGIPATVEQLRSNWLPWLISVLPALWRLIENIRKNAHGDGTPLWRWPWDAITPKPPKRITPQWP